MKRTVLRMLAAATATAALSVAGFTIIAAAQSDEQPTHAELVQRWAEAGIDAQLKGMKTSLRLTADQEEDWGPFESAVKAAEKARVVACKRSKAVTCRRWIATRRRRIASRRVKQIWRRSSKRLSPCTGASTARRNTGSSRLDAC
jgi:hypothetical protein